MKTPQALASEPRLHRIVESQPYPLLFATISGAHLYGFPSPDSDVDLRGAHILPIKNVVGLEVREETVEDSRVIEGLEMVSQLPEVPSAETRAGLNDLLIRLRMKGLGCAA
mgnify:FL=1